MDLSTGAMNQSGVYQQGVAIKRERIDSEEVDNEGKQKTYSYILSSNCLTTDTEITCKQEAGEIDVAGKSTEDKSKDDPRQSQTPFPLAVPVHLYQNVDDGVSVKVESVEMSPLSNTTVLDSENRLDKVPAHANNVVEEKEFGQIKYGFGGNADKHSSTNIKKEQASSLELTAQIKTEPSDLEYEELQHSPSTLLAMQGIPDENKCQNEHFQNVEAIEPLHIDGLQSESLSEDGSVFAPAKQEQSGPSYLVEDTNNGEMNMSVKTGKGRQYFDDSTLADFNDHLPGSSVNNSNSPDSCFVYIDNAERPDEGVSQIHETGKKRKIEDSEKSWKKARTEEDNNRQVASKNDGIKEVGQTETPLTDVNGGKSTDVEKSHFINSTASFSTDSEKTPIANSGGVFCVMCRIVLNSETALIAHLVEKHTTRTVKSGTSFTKMRELSAHLSAVFCSMCRQVLDSETALIAHLTEKHRTYTARYGANSKNILPLPSSIKEFHSYAMSPMSLCNFCMRNFKNDAVCLQHMRCHLSEVPASAMDQASQNDLPSAESDNRTPLGSSTEREIVDQSSKKPHEISSEKECPVADVEENVNTSSIFHCLGENCKHLKFETIHLLVKHIEEIHTAENQYKKKRFSEDVPANEPPQFLGESSTCSTVSDTGSSSNQSKCADTQQTVQGDKQQRLTKVRANFTDPNPHISNTSKGVNPSGQKSGSFSSCYVSSTAFPGPLIVNQLNRPSDGCPSEEMKRKHKLTQDSCVLCLQGFEKVRDFTFHQLLHIQPESGLCLICQETFESQTVWEGHMLTLHFNGIYCPECLKTAFLKEHLCSHLLKFCNGFSCTSKGCSATFLTQCSFQAHKDRNCKTTPKDKTIGRWPKSKKDRNVFKTIVGHEVIVNQTDVTLVSQNLRPSNSNAPKNMPIGRRARFQRNSTVQFECQWPICKRLFPTYDVLKVHEHLYHSKKVVMCQFTDCSKEFPHETYWKDHVITSHTFEEIRFRCCDASCGKTFTIDGALLQRRSTSHTFRCQKCNLKTIFTKLLHQHTKDNH